MSSTAPCRVCHEATRRLFSKALLGKYEAAFFQCCRCQHVQTEVPYWLKESYAARDFRLDAGMAERSINTAKAAVALGWLLGVEKDDLCLDWGAGTGLFVRVCRDHGLNSHFYDPLSENIFARGFELDPREGMHKVKLLTAFEVAEHFPHPAEDFRLMLEGRPEYLFFSTLLYQEQGKEWWYFLENGQHVAFYSRGSLEWLAARFGYSFASNDCDLHLFSRAPVSPRLLRKAWKHREKLAGRYRRRNGSRLESDFQLLLRLEGSGGTMPAG